MAIDFRSVDVNIPGGHAFPKEVKNITVPFGSTVFGADASLKSFNLYFDMEDHHISRVEVVPSVTSINGNTVTLKVTVGYHDHNADDSYHGKVGVLVLARVA